MKIIMSAVPVVCIIFLYVFSHLSGIRYQEKFIDISKIKIAKYQSDLDEALHSSRLIKTPFYPQDGLSKDQVEYLLKISTYKVIVSESQVEIVALNYAKSQIDSISNFVFISLMVSILSFTYSVVSELRGNNKRKVYPC